MRRLIYLCFAALAAAFAVASRDAYAQDRVALVIGNDRYIHLSADKQLSKAVNDARAVGDALEKIGFTVIRGENLDRQSMIDRLFAFTQKVKPGDMAVMFYAGHGVAISGGNYLLPSDVRPAQPGEEARVRNMAIGEADILADIQERKARVAVLMLDACRDNPFRQPGLLRSVGTDRGLGRAREAEGVFALYSAGFGQSALDSLGSGDRSPNSVFTRVLVPALARTDLHLADLVIDVREEVARLAATIGHQQSPAYYDQTRGGRLYLAGRTPAAPASAPSTPPAASAIATTPQPAPQPTPPAPSSFVERFFPSPKGAAPAPPRQIAALPPDAKTPAAPAGKAAVSFDVAIGPHTETDRTPATECDRLVARRYDWERAPGVTGHFALVTIMRPKAIPACREALTKNPESRRLRFLLAQTLTKKTEVEERKALLIDATRRGNLDAPVELGNMLKFGRGFPTRSARTAVRLYEDAGNRGNANGFIAAGSLYSDALGAGGSSKRRSYLDKAVALGSTKAMIEIGDSYKYGSSVTKSYEQAQKWYQQALEAGDLAAYWSLADLGMLHERTKDINQTVEWLKKGAAAGNPMAAGSLGLVYQGYFGLKRDLAAVQTWYERAVALGGHQIYFDALADAVFERGGGAERVFAVLDRMRDYGESPTYSKSKAYFHKLRDPAKGLELLRP
jgi:TPR repeat protein